jgi:hypothetical protein
VPLFRRNLWWYVQFPFQVCEADSVFSTGKCAHPPNSLQDAALTTMYAGLAAFLLGRTVGLSLGLRPTLVVMLAVFAGMRYHWRLTCLPVVPTCLMRDITAYIQPAIPACLCQHIPALLVDPASCNTFNTSNHVDCQLKITEAAPAYNSCPSRQTSIFWNLIFMLRWKMPSIFGIVFGSDDSPMTWFSVGEINDMLSDVTNGRPVQTIDVHCWYLSLPQTILSALVVNQTAALILTLAKNTALLFIAALEILIQTNKLLFVDAPRVLGEPTVFGEQPPEGERRDPKDPDAAYSASALPNPAQGSDAQLLLENKKRA